MSKTGRQRTIHWNDPLATARQGLTMAGRDSGEITAEGQIVHLGRQIAITEGRNVDGRGRLYAAGVETCLVFDAAAAS
jgi:hypothetical protein